jgi:DNA-binding FrmR family transcriptional regulator
MPTEKDLNALRQSIELLGRHCETVTNELAAENQALRTALLVANRQSQQINQQVEAAREESNRLAGFLRALTAPDCQN